MKTNINNFSKRLDKIFEMGDPTKALIIDAFIKAQTKELTDEMSLRSLQHSLPWTIKYSRDFKANPQNHKDFAHAAVHTQKALGKICGYIDDMDHRRKSDVQVVPYVADLIICALRMANTHFMTIDLQQAVILRLETKNGVKLNE